MTTLKSILTFAFLICFTDLAQANVSLADVLKSSPQIADQKSSQMPLQLQDPLDFTVKGVPYQLRFFMFKDTQDENSTFEMGLKKTNQLSQPFVKSTMAPGAFFISSSQLMSNVPDSIEKQGVHYTLSIMPLTKTPDNLPTAQEVLKAAPQIATFKSSGLSFPANPKSLITVGKKQFQVRYFYFFLSNPDASQDITFNQFIQDNGLENMKAEIMDQGYGPLHVFRSNDKMRENGQMFILSLGEVSTS